MACASALMTEVVFRLRIHARATEADPERKQ
jgi:hypothetical protein